jgi:carbonic anhydrase
MLNPWLSNIRDVYRLHREELEAIQDENEQYNRLVELNVQEQCINVCKSRAVQATYFTKGYPDVHGWVYDLKNGVLVDLKLNMPHIMKLLTKIYKVVP